MNLTPLAPLWYEVVVDDCSNYFETLEEAKACQADARTKGASVDDQIYRDSCLPIGTYFVGDPSAVLLDWEVGKGTKYPLENGVYKLDAFTSFALYIAANGPGSYYDEEGNVFHTDSGYLAILPIESPDSCLRDVINAEACEELDVDCKAAIAQFNNVVDTQINRQCEGCIDFGGFPFIFTGDECWYDPGEV
jgi:hypothetical protein